MASRKAGFAVLQRSTMPMCTVLMFVALFCGCSDPNGDSTSSNASRDSLIAAHDRFVEAYEAGDVDGLVALLDPAPDLLIFHPAVESRFDGVDEIRAGLTRMFDLLGEPSWTEVHTQATVRGEVGWLTANLVIETADAALTFVGRSTEIWTYTRGSWALSHAHWSASPESGLD